MTERYLLESNPSSSLFEPELKKADGVKSGTGCTFDIYNILCGEIAAQLVKC